jgi:hypothetical protein
MIKGKRVDDKQAARVVPSILGLDHFGVVLGSEFSEIDERDEGVSAFKARNSTLCEGASSVNQKDFLAEIKIPFGA